jgi:hypothetical protein
MIAKGIPTGLCHFQGIIYLILIFKNLLLYYILNTILKTNIFVNNIFFSWPSKNDMNILLRQKVKI